MLQKNPHLLGSAKHSTKSLTRICCYSAKKHYFIISLCSPICPPVWLYLLCISVTFRAHTQVFCGRGCTIFLWICILQQKILILGNADPAAEGVVQLKVFAFLFSCYFWRVLWVCFFPLHCFLLNLILFIHVAKSGFGQQWRILL